MFASAAVAKPVAVQAGSARVQRRGAKVVVAAYQPEKQQNKAAAALFGALSAGALLAGAPDAQALGNPYDYPGAPSTPEQAVQELKDAGKQIKEKVTATGDNNTNNALYTGEKIFKKVSDVNVSDGAKGDAEGLINKGKSALGNAKSAIKDTASDIGGGNPLGAAKNAASDAASNVKGGLNVGNPFSAAKDAASDAASNVKGGLGGVGNPIGAAKSAARNIKDTASNAVDNATGGFGAGDLADKARNAANNAASTGNAEARDIRNPSKKPFRTGNDLAGNNAGNAVSGAGNAVSGAGNDLARNTGDAVGQAAESVKSAAKSAFNKF